MLKYQKKRGLILLILGTIMHSTHAGLLISSTSSLHVQFSALLPPFITWKNRDETVNIPLSIGSSTQAPIEIETQISPNCQTRHHHANAVCMTNTTDSAQVIHYTVKYIPCGSIKPFYLSDRDRSRTQTTFGSSYTNWNECKMTPGLISFTRLSLFEKPLPSSGLYSGSITLELREL